MRYLRIMKIKLLPKTEKVYGTKKVGDKHLGCHRQMLSVKENLNT